MDTYEQEQADKWALEKFKMEVSENDLNWSNERKGMISFQPGSILEFNYNGTRRIVVVVEDTENYPGTFLAQEIEKDYQLHDSVKIKRFKFLHVGKES